MGENNVFYKGLNEFNKLPSNIRNSNSLKKCKEKLIGYLNNSWIYKV